MKYSEKDLDILARTIYGEARGEFYLFGITPLLAVANVIVNRYRKNFGKSISEICLAPYQFSCWNKNDVNYKIITQKTIDDIVFGKCQEIAEKVLNEKWPDITYGCDHYHARAIKPKWAVGRIPNHIFGTQYFYSIKN